MGQLSFLICADSEVSTDAIRHVLEMTGHARVGATIVDPASLAAEVEAHRPDALLGAFCGNPNGMLEAMEQLPAPRPLLVICGPQEDTLLLIRAIRLGVKEFLPPDPDEAQVHAIVERLVLEQAGSAAAEKQLAPVISVIGANGGIGATTVACQLAATLQRSASTAIVDLDLSGGDVALHFDVIPRHTVADLSGKVDELDATYLRTLLETHRTQVQILASPARPEQVDILDPTSFERALEILREDFDWVILDVSRSWRECNLRALDLSDQILLVTGFDVAALHHSRSLMQLFSRLGCADRLQLVANRRCSANSVDDRDFKEFLERQPDIQLPNDFESAAASIEQGKPVSEIAGNGALDRAFVELAKRVYDWCDVPFPEPTPRKSRIARLLRKVIRNGAA